MEMIISMSLLSLLLSLVVALHLNGQKMWAKGADSEGIMGDSLIVLRRLTKDLQRSSFSSVSFNTEGTALAFMNTDSSTEQAEYNPTGKLVWDSWLVYYQQENKLFRKEIPWSDPLQDRVFPITIEAHSGQALNTFLDGQGRELASDLVSAAFSRVDSTNLVQYELIFRAERSQDRTLKLEGRLGPRNL